MNALIASIWIASIGLQAPQSTFEEIDILKAAVRSGLTSTQAKAAAKIAQAIELHLDRRSQELSSYLAREKALSAITQRMSLGETLTAAEEQHLKTAELVRMRIFEGCQTKIDGEFRKALALLTVEQLFRIVLRRQQLEGTQQALLQIRTASDDQWEKVRETLAHRLTDDEYFALVSEAARKWEAETGKRTDMPGSDFSAKAAGIEKPLEAIRQKGRDYLQGIRDTGGQERDLVELSAALLGPALKELRTWPPPTRYRYLRGTPDGVPIQKLVANEGKRDNPYHPGHLLEVFLTNLLVTPGAAKVLEKYNTTKS